MVEGSPISRTLNPTLTLTRLFGGRGQPLTLSPDPNPNPNQVIRWSRATPNPNPDPDPDPDLTLALTLTLTLTLTRYAVLVVEGNAARTSTVQDDPSPRWPSDAPRAFRFPLRQPG